MKDQLERDIKHLFSNSGELDRDEVALLLLGLLTRIQQLEAKLEEKTHEP